MKADKRTKTDRIMDFADELGSLTSETEDKKAWGHLLVYAPLERLVEALSRKVKKTIHSSFDNSYKFYLN